MRSKIKEIIKKKREIFGQGKILIKKLPWGIWNYNYKVEVNGKKYTFKIYSELRHYGYFSNIAEREFQVLKFMENTGITPKVVLFDDSKKILDHDVLVYEYVEGKSLRNKNEDVEKAAEILAKLHSIKVDKINFLDKKENSMKELFENSLKEFKLYQKKENKNSEITAEIKGFIKKLKAANQIKLKFKPSIIHNDLVPSNLIKKEQVHLIDWQGTWIGDPAFDCWAFTSDVFNRWDWKDILTAEQKELFWKKYLTISKDKDIRKRAEIKTPHYYMKILIYSLNKFSDYKTGKLPEELIGREHHFEKYEKIIEMCLDNLRKNIK